MLARELIIGLVPFRIRKFKFMPLTNPPQLAQVAAVMVSADTTTTSTSFVDLLTLTLTTEYSFVECHFTSCPQITAGTAANISFQLLVDGVSVAKTHNRILGSGAIYAPSSIRYKTGLLTPDNHIFKIQWATSAGTASILSNNTSIINATTLLLREVTA